MGAAFMAGQPIRPIRLNLSTELAESKMATKVLFVWKIPAV
jgi:hypothetical protein